MGKRRYPGIVYLLLIASYGTAFAADGFDDNDHDMDFFSAGKNSNFDLRHTIPGEPGIDYPIYHEVPATNFVCDGRHEGYYADMESRCQAFHICTHTARSQHGFGFLCPNGTLFSQKNFVCDWYRNVNCDESERYYGKNDANRIGSSRDMMETVRQMIEYPMRTITKALQSNVANTRRPTTARQTQKKALNEAVIPVNSATQSLPIQRKPVTRAEVEKAYAYGNENAIPTQPLLGNAVAANRQQQQQQRGTTATTVRPTSVTPAAVSANIDDVEGASRYSLDTGNNDLSLDASGEDVYVNSLGELSTDPGVEFNRTNAHVIAEYPRKYHLEKQLNFAAKINAGLNNVVDVPSLDVLAPDYIKRIRMTKEEAVQHDLISNINGLLDEVSTDLDPKQSGYQSPNPPKPKQTFRFLSRGFESSERIRKTAPYVYKRPPQTPSTISFTPISTTPIPSETHTDTLDTQNIDTVMSDETFQEINTLAELNADIENDIGDVNERPKFEALTQTTTQPDDLAETSVGSKPASEAPSEVADSATGSSASSDSEQSITNEEKIDVNKHAENLLVAGVQLSTLANKTDNIEQVHVATTEQPAIAYVHVGSDADVDALILQLVQETVNVTSHPITRSADTPKTTTTTEEPTAAATTTALTTSTVSTTEEEATTAATTGSTMRTSTETVTEVNSTQERLRGFRRFNSFQRGNLISNSNNKTNNIKPLIYGKRANVRVIPSRTRTTTTLPPTTSRPATTTLSYLKRVAASRLRLAKLTAGKNATVASAKPSTSTTAVPAGSAATTEGENQSSSTASTVTWDSVRNNLQRFQVNRRQRPPHHVTRSTTLRPQLTTPLVPHYPRAQHRFSNFKTQTTRGNRTATRSRGPPMHTHTQAQTPTTTLATPTPNTEHIHIDLNYILNSLTNAPTSAVATTAATVQSSSLHLTPPPTTKPATNAAPVGVVNLSDLTDQLTSIDKLRRSIVDDSILQNFQSQQRHHNDGKYNGGYAGKGAGPREKNFIAGTSTSTFIASQRVEHKPQLPQIQIPGIVIARAEGQRILPTSVDKVINSLVTQKPTTTSQTAAYVPLNDFLTNKFGYTVPASPKTTATTYFGQQQTQRQHKHQEERGPTNKPQESYEQQEAVVQVQAPQLVKPLQQQQQIVQFKPSQPQTQQQQQTSSNYPAPKNPFFAPVYPSSQYTQHHTRPQATAYQQQPHHHPQHPQQQQQSYNQRTQNPFGPAAGNRGVTQVQQQQIQQYQQVQAVNQYQLQQQQLQQKQQPAQSVNQYQQQKQQQQVQLVNHYQQQQQQQQQLQQQQQKQQQIQPVNQYQQQQQQQHQGQKQSIQQVNQYQQQQQQQQQQLQYNQQRIQQPVQYQQQQYFQQQQQKQFVQPPAQQVQPPPIQQQRELSSVFVNYQQHQRQLPQFPPLNEAAGTASNAQLTAPQATPAYTAFAPNNNNNNNNINDNNNYLNVQLPAVPAGLIPAPNTQLAQKRSDTVAPAAADEQPAALALNENAFSSFVGASSYDVPINSIGRLPNDIAAALRRRLRRY